MSELEVQQLEYNACDVTELENKSISNIVNPFI